MNLMTIWFLTDEFRSLTATGKIAVVAGFILMILLVTLWARWLTRKHDAMKLPVSVQPSANKLVEKCKDATSESTNSNDLQKQRKNRVIWHCLLSTFRNDLRKWRFQYHAEDDGYNQKDPVQTQTRTRFSFPQSRHIRTIVNKLRRRVNQSGKEPPG